MRRYRPLSDRQSRHRQLSKFAGCLLLSLALHGVIATLLSLKSRLTEVAVSGGSTVITATLMPASAWMPSPLPRTEQSVNRLAAGTTKQTPVVPVKPATITEKKSLKAEKSPAEVAPGLSSKNTASKNTASKNTALKNTATKNTTPLPTITTEQLSAGKVPAVVGSDSAKKTSKLPKTTKKSATGTEQPCQQQGNEQSQSADLDHFFDNLATRPSTSVASAGQGSVSGYQCSQYAAQIKSAIQSNLIKDTRYQGKSCEIALQLAADGMILQAQLRRGDPAVCAAALRAVGMTGSVPKPTDEKLYETFKNIVISFEL